MQNQTKKNLKNPCKLHNGNHGWDDCCQNPKNAKNDEKDKTGNGHNKNEQNGSGRSREHRRTKRSSCHSSTTHSCSNSRERDSSSSDYEYNGINEQKLKQDNSGNTPSSEILIALPNAANSKKYTTYLGLIDSGSSGSLLNNGILANTDFSVQHQKRPTKWDKATGVLLTKGKVTIPNFCLPQFTIKCHVSSTFHLFASALLISMISSLAVISHKPSASI
jgi:hypothetical protein